MPITTEMLGVACATLVCPYDADTAPPPREPDTVAVSLLVTESPAGAAIVARDPSGALVVLIGDSVDALSKVAGAMFPTATLGGTAGAEPRAESALQNAADILASLRERSLPQAPPLTASSYAILSLEGR